MSLDFVTNAIHVDIDVIRHSGELRLEIRDADIAECIDRQDIIREYGIDELLDGMLDSDLIQYLEEQGYTVTYGG